MKTLRNFFNPLHKSTKREYLPRMLDDKVECMKLGKKFGFHYWDGDRRYGYGGYFYDGRWKPVAQAVIDAYGLKDDASILDVGCGKAYLLYEFKQLLPKARIAGFDVSPYAVEKAKPEIRDTLFVHPAQELYPYEDGEFDLVLAVNSLHNLEIFDLKKALSEMERVGREKYFCVESYRNDQELFNLQCWALTCEAFQSRDAWIWLLKEFGYTGDYEFIYFE